MPTSQTPSEKLEAQLPKIDSILTPQEYMRIIDLISSDNRLEPNNQDFIIWETILEKLRIQLRTHLPQRL
tara:strand:+ start:346 stop:555 length:210 start_codon:yes stop_codon:yes gene_type:complete